MAIIICKNSRLTPPLQINTIQPVKYFQLYQRHLKLNDIQNASRSEHIISLLILISPVCNLGECLSNANGQSNHSGTYLGHLNHPPYLTVPPQFITES